MEEAQQHEQAPDEEEEVEELPPVFILGEPQQNPLRLLPLLVQGFCPHTVPIRDSVDVNDDHLDMCNTPLPPPHQGKASATSRNVKHSEHGKHATTSNRKEQKKRRHRYDDTSERPFFEIMERPPSDVISISKKIWEEKVWEGFCYNPIQSTSSSHQPAQEPSNSPEKPEQENSHKNNNNRGFCINWTCFPTDEDRAKDPPSGEECSIASHSDCSTAELTPQSSPQQQQRRQMEYLEDDPASFLALPDDECFQDHHQSGEEVEEPVVEYARSVARIRRNLLTWGSTVLALFVTVTLLSSISNPSPLDASSSSLVGQQQPQLPYSSYRTINFSVQPKHNHPPSSTTSSSTISLFGGLIQVTPKHLYQQLGASQQFTLLQEAAPSIENGTQDSHHQVLSACWNVSTY